MTEEMSKKQLTKKNETAILARDMFLRFITDYIMMYYGILDGQVDLIVCSTCVFENSSFFRKRTFNLLSKSLGIKLDKSLNKKMIRGD